MPRRRARLSISIISAPRRWMPWTWCSTCWTARLRAVWLTLNLATAVLASFVIGQFEGAIEKIGALAVLMPIVASMGGNAGTQTVTVAVRALAMGELTAANALRFVAKEAAVGGLNGMIFALLMGAAVVAWYDDLSPSAPRQRWFKPACADPRHGVLFADLAAWQVEG